MSEHDSPSPDNMWDEAAETAAESPPRDVVTGRLVYATLLTAVAVFALLAYVLYSLLVAPRAPRTAVERDVMVMATIVEQAPQSPHAWGDYVRALINAEDYGRAGRVLQDARSAVGTASPVLIEEARLLDARGRTDEAIEAVDIAVAQAEAEVAERTAALAAKGVVQQPDTSDVVDAYLLKARILVSMDRREEATDAFGEALALKPSMADVLVERGELYLEIGDATSAAADFESALEYIPDMESALQGLERTKAVTGQ